MVIMIGQRITRVQIHKRVHETRKSTLKQSLSPRI